MNKSLLFITARLPYPATSGRKNVMFNYCRILHDVYNYDISIISFLEDGDCIEPKPYFIKDVIVLENISIKRKLLNLFNYTFIKKRFPMQVSLYYAPEYLKKISKIIETSNPNVVMADMVRTTEYLRTYNGYKIADLDDMLSIRYSRQLEMDINTINPYGAYLYSLPTTLQKVLSNNLFKKCILANEAKLLRQYEQEISLCYDKTIFVAEKEAMQLNKEMNFDKAIGIPLGVDIKYFGEYYNKVEVKKNTITFLGAMSVAHNEAGVIHFINDIFPLILKKSKDTKFIIVGGGVTEKVKDIASGNTSIEFAGRVDDVRPYIASSNVFVCPLTFGSGIKTKNLEAMAMGVPVVTTTIGAENINAVNRKDYIIADDNISFSDAVVELMCDEELYTSIRKNAYSFVKKNFTWDVTEKKMRTIFK